MSAAVLAMAPRLTPHQRAQRRIALKWIRFKMRGFAMERRRVCATRYLDSYGTGIGWGSSHSMILLARELNAITSADYVALNARCERIARARITRQPRAQ